MGLGYNYNLASRVNSNTSNFSTDPVKESSYGRVVDILLDDTREWMNVSVNEKYPIGTVKCIRLNKDNQATDVIVYAYPSTTAISNFPLYNEVVALKLEPISDLQFNVTSTRLYYSHVVNLWGSKTNNSLPSDNFDGQNLLGPDAVALNDINPLYPFPGDTLIEGRQGQSIRIGGFKSPKNKLVDSSNNGKPYVLISNGQIKTDNGVDHIVEDINKDPNSIYLLSNHKVPLQEANSKRDSYDKAPTKAKDYKGNQLIINADRVFINAKNESVIISSKKSIGISSDTLNFDASTYLCLDAPLMYLGSKARTAPKGLKEPVILGNQLENFLAIMLDTLQNIGVAMVAAEATTGGPVGSLNLEGYCVQGSVKVLQSLLGQNSTIKSKKVFVE